MKNQFLSMLLSASFTMCLLGMQVNNNPARLYLKNTTQDKISVVRKHQYEESLGQTYDPNNKPVNIGDIATLQLLTVDRDGRYKRLASLHGLAGSYWALENHVDKVHEARRKYGAVPLLAKVHYGYCGGILGYTVTVEPYVNDRVKNEPQGPILHCLWDNFEQVKKASIQGKKIEARYFLNISESTTKHEEIEHAYIYVRTKWLEDLASPNQEVAARAKRCLQFIDAAFWSLIRGGETTRVFEDMVKAEEEAGISDLYLCPLE